MDKPLSRAIKKVQKKKITEQVPNTTTRRNVRSSEFRTKAGDFDKAAYDAAKGRKETNKGGGRPRKKGGALATTTGSSVQKTSSGSMTTTNKNSGVDKAKPDAKNQTINVKATEVGGDLAKKKSKVGSMSNSGKQNVDPKKNTSIVKVGKQNDNSKTYDKETLSKNRGTYRSTPSKDEKEKKNKRKQFVRGVVKKTGDVVKKAGSMAKSAISTSSGAFGTSSFNKESKITFKQFIDKTP